MIQYNRIVFIPGVKLILCIQYCVSDVNIVCGSGLNNREDAEILEAAGEFHQDVVCI